MKANLPELDLRVQDGKFTVMNYFEKDPNDVKEVEDGERKYAKQKIQTVKTTNICYQVYYLLKRCIRNKGQIKKFSMEKTIMEKVNLYFEPGKMYLVMYVKVVVENM